MSRMRMQLRKVGAVRGPEGGISISANADRRVVDNDEVRE